jgi:cytochrome c oxidase subunit 2
VRLGRTLKLLGVLLVAVAGCARDNHTTYAPVGPQAGRINSLWWITLWITTAVFFIVIVTLAIGLLKRHASTAADTSEAAERRRSQVVAGAIGLTVLTVFFLLVASISTGRATAALQSKSAINIEVTGHQWWWEVRYSDPDASHIVHTANEIHIPVGQPVVITTASADVIHSFWAPNIHGKRDLIPGYSTAFWIQADQEGTFRGQCAEFCGHQHAHMAFFIIAESPEKFQSWLENQRKPAVEPDDAEKLHGREVFLQSPCVMCHTIRGTKAGSVVAPDLTHLASRQTIAAGTLPNNRGSLGGWIVDSQSIKPGNKMPPNNLSGDDLNALLAYLQSLN